MDRIRGERRPARRTRAEFDAPSAPLIIAGHSFGADAGPLIERDVDWLVDSLADPRASAEATDAADRPGIVRPGSAAGARPRA